jgi:cell division GTPase FtsZ
LYPYNFRGAKAILLNIEGEKNLGLFEVEKISKNIQELAHKEARIIFGVSPTKKYPNKIKITLLATGCLAKIFSQKEKKEKKIKKIKKIIQKKPKKEKILKKKKRKKKIKKKKEVKKEKKKEFLSKQKKEIPKIEKEKEEKIRKNALQVKKEIEAQEEELLSQEKIWETPAFLRKQKENSL